MKLTKLHIFIIILIALILCPTLGACSIEGFVNRTDPNATPQNTFSSYGGSGGYDKSVDATTIANNTNSKYSGNTSPMSYMNTANTASSASSTNSKGSPPGILSWFTNLFK
jgi:hypothetical protein